MQVSSSSIRLVACCYLPFVIYPNPSQGIQTTTCNISGLHPYLLVAVDWCLVTVYTISKNSIQQAKCTFHCTDVTDHFIGWKRIPGCWTVLSLCNQSIIHKSYNWAKINIFYSYLHQKYIQYIFSVIISEPVDTWNLRCHKIKIVQNASSMTIWLH